MNDQILSALIGLSSGLIGAITGAISQYFLQGRSIKKQIDIEHKSRLYTELFDELRNQANDQIKIKSLLCKAQIYASDSVLDILEKINVKKGFDDKLLFDLLKTIREELRPESKKRNLHIFSYKQNGRTSS
jgi:hypothetical protein